mgnify:CR=1 FL=1
MKSIISCHTATKKEILTRVTDVINCGVLVKFEKMGNTRILKYELAGSLPYIITFVSDKVVSLELENVYLFIL